MLQAPDNAGIFPPSSARARSLRAGRIAATAAMIDEAVVHKVRRLRRRVVFEIVGRMEEDSEGYDEERGLDGGSG